MTGSKLIELWLEYLMIEHKLNKVIRRKNQDHERPAMHNYSNLSADARTQSARQVELHWLSKIIYKPTGLGEGDPYENLF